MEDHVNRCKITAGLSSKKDILQTKGYNYLMNNSIRVANS